MNRGRGCFNCGKEGHKSFECPDSRRRRSPERSNRGYNDRPSRYDEEGSNSRNCYNCGKPGHLARDCPEPRKPGPSRGGPPSDKSKGGCYNCGESGHIARNCPNPRKDRDKEPINYVKYLRGGEDRDGERRGGRRTDVECYNCGKVGHISRDCPQKQKRHSHQKKSYSRSSRSRSRSVSSSRSRSRSSSRGKSYSPRSGSSRSSRSQGKRK